MPSADPTTGLEIRLFGPFRVRVHSAPLPPLRTRKGQWLLALLALCYDQEIERSWLTATLWPDSSESQALYNLRRSLSDLRQALGARADCIQTPTLHRLRFDSAHCDLDIIAFKHALDGGDEQALEQAVALYAGPVLEGCTEAWVMAERATWEQAYVEALEKLAALALKHGEEARAVSYLRRVLRAAPLRETALRQLLSAQARQGELSEAVQTYRDFRLRLSRELNAQPAPETLALYRRIRREAQQSASPAPPAPEPSVFVSCPLPQPLTTFIGREEELEQIESLLMQTRLLTLTGTGGVGKTRLALRAAEELAPAFGGAVCFIELGTLTSPALIEQTLAAALEVPQTASLPLLQALLAHLRSLRLLLVLDNCEHLIAGCREIIAELLSNCPRLHVLATSRQALGMSGEAVLRVPSLSLPASDTLTSALSALENLLEASAALRLFIDRAALSRPSFRLTAQNAAPVAQICARLDGIPLAIELVAAYVRSLSVDQIASRLEANFRLLTRGETDRPSRHQTLTAAMDWSYALLSEEERRLLRRLSIFSGGFALEAAEAICAETGETVLEGLLSLLEKSLVVYEDQEGEGRYRLLETIRHYAAQKLAETEEEAALNLRHRDHYTTLAEEAARNLTGGEQVAWLTRLDRERDNLRGALDRGDPISRLRLAAALWGFWFIRGHFSEGQRWLEDALSQQTAQTAERGMALYGAGNLAMQQSDYAAAIGFLREAQAVHQALGDSQSAARDLNSLGAIAIQQGDLASARSLLEQSLILLRLSHNQHAIAQVLCNLGAVALALDDKERAKAFFEESLPLLHAQGAEPAAARCLSNLAIIAKEAERFTEARTLHQQGLEIHRRLGDSQGVAHVLSNLASLEMRMDNYAESETLFHQALPLWKELGDKAGIAYVLTGMAQLAGAQGAMERAARLFGASEALREAIHFPIPPLEREEYDRSVALAREACEEQKFTANWKSGQLMTLEQALDFAGQVHIHL